MYESNHKVLQINTSTRKFVLKQQENQDQKRKKRRKKQRKKKDKHSENKRHFIRNEN